ncbi:uncharacterized protein F4822DRAFT_439179 [Hypoxylon trugodes]|uniref:uncharacterized protein n=1 Tax=Hypoxylon trugodes TaxID=326681 RepID=UPI002190ADB4|nr:uncharacterized protein F4822DRAFT_439179 [Hypoxylon trugodes]KAI1382772.1 hypothetical protein F4822DRAFT_439179 [Hypoxylon trugodes]
MGSFERTSSPVLTMSPSAAHQGAFGMSPFSHHTSPFSRPKAFGAPSPWSQPSGMARSTAGRKRSRDEAGVNLDVEEVKLQTIEPVKEPEDEWVYGEGMVLIKSPLSYVADAGSQSGTWLEEKTAAAEARKNEEARAINQQERPSLRSSKSQRLDMNAIAVPGIESQINRSSPIRDVDPAVSTPGLSADTSSQPIIDNFTLHLGIGWNRISEDEHIQAAARGWARYIENHFPVTNVRIQLESKGLQSYLVEATEGFFLFAENLRQGQLVSKDLNRTFANLKMSPPVFEGPEVMSAAESPRPIEATTAQEVVMAPTFSLPPVFMISQPDHSLTLRGPSSVVSSRTASRPHASSRSKRYNRSHAGGSSYVPQNEFPVFSHSGDVEIFIMAGGRENRYLLHKHTLTRCSGFFEASTSQEWSKASLLPLPDTSSKELTRIGEEGASSSGSEVARPGASSPVPRRRWRYELDPGTGGDDVPMLVQKEANSSSAPEPTQPNSIFGGGSVAANTPAARKASHSHTYSTSSFFRSVANLSLAPTKPDPVTPLSQADVDLLRDYDNLFRIFYNYSPVLDSISIADAYVQCKSLLTLADQYDALAVVGPRVDHHLLQFQSRLWKQIAKYPISYLRLGYLSRSKVIFQEALIHVVGQWPAGERSIRQSFPEIVLDIIEDKVDELEETVSRIEGRLFRLNLTNSRGERVTPNTSYLDWLAVSLFRQWLADNTSPAPVPPPSSSRGQQHNSGSARAAAVVATASTTPNLASLGRTYRTLGSLTGAGYLSHDDCKRFLKLTPDLYSRENLRRFEKRIDELKCAAREIVRPLMGSGLELELERSAIMPGNASVGVPSMSVIASGMTSYLTCVQVMERDLPWTIEE